MCNNNREQGSAVVYLVLFVFMMMTSAAIILSGVLTRHIRSADEYVASERAFSAANTGIEQMLYAVARSNDDVKVKGTLDYANGQATYDGHGKGNPTCMVSVGLFGDTVRRIAIGEGVSGCDL